MSSITQSHQTPETQMVKAASKKWLHIGLALTVATLALSATGCSTTQEFKPTASVLVGAHKSL